MAISHEAVFLVAMAEGSHPIPSRTRSLSLPAPMVLQGRPCGRVGRRQIYGPLGDEGAFFIGSARLVMPSWTPCASRRASCVAEETDAGPRLARPIVVLLMRLACGLSKALREELRWVIRAGEEAGCAEPPLTVGSSPGVGPSWSVTVGASEAWSAPSRARPVRPATSAAADRTRRLDGQPGIERGRVELVARPVATAE